jgi:hypothetical protein
VLGVAEPDGDQHEVRRLDELAARHRVQVARRGALHAPSLDRPHAPVLAGDAGDLRSEAPVAALLERVGRGRALGR